MKTIHAHEMAPRMLRERFLAIASEAATPSSSPGLRTALEDVLLSYGHAPVTLAFSGGSESVVLAETFRALQRPFKAIVLETARRHRDADAAVEAAASQGIPLERLRVTEEDVLRVANRHRDLLLTLSNQTHRILAVCEIFLGEAALRDDRTLVTGHGPEAVLGGFRRRPIPSLENTDAILDSLAANLHRLRSVEAAVGCTIELPFLDERVFAALVAMRREGLDKTSLAARAGCALIPAEKISLQNGSGVHYLFEEMARRNGHRLTRDYMEALLA
jgi:asparagine synthetase B (glutamine-hydrolysing)